LRNSAPLSNGGDQVLRNGLLSRYAQQDEIDAARELLVSGAPCAGNYAYLLMFHEERMIFQLKNIKVYAPH
jgi:hypothetical protein